MHTLLKKSIPEVPASGSPLVTALCLENSLSKFLRAHECKITANITHTSMRSPAGSFHIPVREYHHFLALYNKARLAGQPLHLTEKHKSISPVLIDLDFRQDSNERLYDINYIGAFLNALVTIVFEYVDQDVVTCYILEKPAPRPCKNGGFKDGLHFVFPDAITNAPVQYAIRDNMLQSFHERISLTGVNNAPSDIYDEAVIERNNWFMYGSMKPDEKHPWLVTRAIEFNRDGTMRDLTNNIEQDNLAATLSIRLNAVEDSPYTEAGHRVASRAEATNASTSVVSTVVTQDVLSIVRKLVDILDIARADNYITWIQVGWCLHNIDQLTLLDSWVRFSEKSTKFIPGECERLWHHMRDQGLNIGSLHMWAKSDSPVSYVDIMSKAKCQDDEVTIEDIQRSPNQYNYSYIKSVFERRCAKVLNPLCYIELDNGDNGNLIMRKEEHFKKAYRNIFCLSKKSEVCRFVDAWFDDPLIRTYRRLDFIPPPLTCPPGVFNTWKGFGIDKVHANSSGNIEPFLKHASIIVGNDQASIDYFLKWLAQLVQQPGRLIGIALVFVSDEGAGKNIFWDAFFNMLGVDYYFETANPEHELFGKHANGRKFKLLIDIDEAKMKDTFGNSDRLKNMITSEHFNYEQKGVDPVTLRNFARIILTTNNELCVKITDNNRRYVVFETSNEKIGNLAYFSQFATYMADPSNQKAIIDYLRSIDITNYNFQVHRPISDLYRAIQSTCSDLVLQFMEYLWKVQNIDEYVYTATDLLRRFHTFLETKLQIKPEARRNWNAQMFGRRLNKLVADSHGGLIKSINFGVKKQNAYTLCKNGMMLYLQSKGVLTETSYMFLDDSDGED
jgi:hypothetical protein